jgi:hypothetical protein
MGNMQTCLFCTVSTLEMLGMLQWNTSKDDRVIAAHRNISGGTEYFEEWILRTSCKQNVVSGGLETAMLWIQLSKARPRAN